MAQKIALPISHILKICSAAVISVCVCVREREPFVFFSCIHFISRFLTNLSLVHPVSALETHSELVPFNPYSLPLAVSEITHSSLIH